MKCDHVKSYIMDYLYDELDPGIRDDFLQSLENCPECLQELKEFQATRSFLQAVPEIEPSERLIFQHSASPLKARWQAIKAALPKPWWARLGLAGGFATALLLIFASIGNLEVSFTNDGFHARMSLLPRAHPTAPAAVDSILATLRAEQASYLTELLRSEQVEQDQRINKILETYTEDLNRQRIEDLLLIDRGFEAFQRNTRQDLQQTHRYYEQMMQNVRFEK